MLCSFLKSALLFLHRPPLDNRLGRPMPGHRSPFGYLLVFYSLASIFYRIEPIGWESLDLGWYVLSSELIRIVEGMGARVVVLKPIPIFVSCEYHYITGSDITNSPMIPVPMHKIGLSKYQGSPSICIIPEANKVSCGFHKQKHIIDLG
jgi:hypothetical protein